MKKDTFNGIDIFAFFFREDADLADSYIEYTKKYIALYEPMLGKFPYQRFSIVENSLQTGYSMPTYTLLGSAVVRLPFIVKTSLGHEILHQWFGNYVYIDYKSGNWAEGLTTYLADHLYKEIEGRGWEYRKQALIDYRSYVSDKNDFPLKEFKRRTDYATRTIGYGKSAMVFHMLKRMMGQERFTAALRDFIRGNRYREASWDDIRKSFSAAYGQSLDGFFDQWLNRKGLPDIEFSDFVVTPSGRDKKLTFTAKQKGATYSLDMPLTIYYDSGYVKRTVHIDKESQEFTVTVPGRPVSVVFDEEYDLARRLSDREFPPVIARLIGDPDLILVLPEEDNPVFSELIESMGSGRSRIMKPRQIRQKEIESSSIIMLGRENPVARMMFGDISFDDAGFGIIVMENPWNTGKVAAVVDGVSADEINAAFRKVLHYGGYSKLFFKGGKNVLKETAESEKGIVMNLRDETTAIDVSGISSLNDVIEAISSKKIIYIGEMHDSFAHHAVQLDIISGLYEKDNRIAIGMEMFQRPFQDVLDRYIAGEIDEGEFLRKSEYFKRWGYDYNLYKPIIEFARTEKIPVIALNMEREIIDKVSSSGMESLSSEERSKIPSGMDFSNDRYRERLQEIFKLHRGRTKKSFSNFFQSQIMWDETMAESIDRFMKENPDRQMIVIAGQGHLMYGSGIPSRAFRRNGLDYSIVLIDSEVKKGIADYVLFPAPVEGVTSPKLEVYLKEEKGRFRIAGFPGRSVSEKAGIKKGDVIISIDGTEIWSIDDIKIILLNKRKGDIVKVKVRRRTLGISREAEIEVTL
jgi:uncharacterized iron-regulated protein